MAREPLTLSLCLLLWVVGCPAQTGSDAAAPDDSAEAVGAPRDVFAAEASPRLETELVAYVRNRRDATLAYASLRRLEELQSEQAVPLAIEILRAPALPDEPREQRWLRQNAAALLGRAAQAGNVEAQAALDRAPEALRQLALAVAARAEEGSR
jgi:hypothetical protein